MCLPTTRHQKLYIQIVKEQCHAETRRDETYCSAATFSEIGGARRDRTADLLRAKQALSQLSYGPPKKWWVWEDLNFRPHPYQGCALTN